MSSRALFWTQESPAMERTATENLFPEETKKRTKKKAKRHD